MSKTVPSLFAVASLLAGVPAVAGEMRAEEARQFVADKLFSFTCFEGTSGEGRVHADGSVGGWSASGAAGRRVTRRSRPERCGSGERPFAP